MGAALFMFLWVLLGCVPIVLAMSWRAVLEYTPLMSWIVGAIFEDLPGSDQRIYANVDLFLWLLGTILCCLGEARLLSCWRADTRGWIVMSVLSLAFGELVAWPVRALTEGWNADVGWVVTSAIEGLIWGVLSLLLLREWGWRTHFWMRAVCAALMFAALAVALVVRIPQATWWTLGLLPEPRAS